MKVFWGDTELTPEFPIVGIKVGNVVQSPVDGVVSFPAYPTSLPANGGTANTANNVPTADVGGNIWVG
jgi:hypothetical protein